MDLRTQPVIEESCCSCGTPMWMTESFKQALRNKKQTFYCINGHAQSYTESEADVLKKQLASKDALLFNAHAKIRDLEFERVLALKKAKKKKK